MLFRVLLRLIMNFLPFRGSSVTTFAGYAQRNPGLDGGEMTVIAYRFLEGVVLFAADGREYGFDLWFVCILAQIEAGSVFCAFPHAYFAIVAAYAFLVADKLALK